MGTSKKKKPPKWIHVYPAGTKEGDEECKLFKVLSRNPKYEWRSTDALRKETGLPKQRVEEILSKYFNKGMVFQNPKNEDQWGYWERVPEMLPDIDKSIAAVDQGKRIDKIVKTAFTPAEWKDMTKDARWIQLDDESIADLSRTLTAEIDKEILADLEHFRSQITTPLNFPQVAGTESIQVDWGTPPEISCTITIS